ncbi:Highly reducing polyketide synthase Dhc3 [Metarhizium anisopliae]
MPPIKGCIQSSMVLENRMFGNYTLETFNSALGSKIQGTINLHNLLPPGMDFFVLLSSLAGVCGAGSQTSYGAANAFLDSFARFRHAQGEQCISLDLGIIEQVGRIAESADVARNVAMVNLDSKVLRVAAALTTPAHVRRGGVLQDHNWMRLPMFQPLYRMEQSQADSVVVAKANNTRLKLEASKTLAEAGAVISKLFAERLARSLAMPIEDIDLHKPPYSYSVDSLIAVELLFWFSTEIRADMAVLQILSGLSIFQLGSIAAEKSQYVKIQELAG